MRIKGRETKWIPNFKQYDVSWWHETIT